MGVIGNDYIAFRILALDGDYVNQRVGIGDINGIAGGIDPHLSPVKYSANVGGGAGNGIRNDNISDGRAVAKTGVKVDYPDGVDHRVSCLGCDWAIDVYI